MAAYSTRSGALHCAFCRYPLDGLHTHDPARRRCPECGAPYWQSSLERHPRSRSAILRLSKCSVFCCPSFTARTAAIAAFIVGAAIITAALAVNGYTTFRHALGLP